VTGGRCAPSYCDFSVPQSRLSAAAAEGRYRELDRHRRQLARSDHRIGRAETLRSSRSSLDAVSLWALRCYDFGSSSPPFCLLYHLVMTKGFAAFIFLSALCACSSQGRSRSITFQGRPGQADDPRAFLDSSKQWCEAHGREFTLLEPPPHWRFSCELPGKTAAPK
jgi:hypothetical protein